MRTRVAAVVAVVVVAGIAARTEQGGPGSDAAVLLHLRTQIPGRDLALDPPRVADAVVEAMAQPTASANTLLRVRFAKDETLPPRLDYLAGDSVATLADDGAWPDAQAGDGVYTAAGSMDLARFEQDLTAMAASATAQPAGTYRSRSRTATGAVLDPAALRQGGLHWEPWGDPATVDPERSLLVRDPGVVEDPERTRVGCGGGSMGPWSFGHLMDEIAMSRSAGSTDVGDVNGARLARLWLASFDTDQWSDGWMVKARPGLRAALLDPWIAASGGPDVPLDLSRAPFRLLAIVNRFDIRRAAAYGGLDSGELRFVFTALSPSCEPLPFTVIFEFAVTPPTLTGGCFAAQAWARRWKALETETPGTPEYNAALEAITEAVVRNGVDPTRVNASALNRLRTNENAFGPPGAALDWEMRQFELRDIGIGYTDHLSTVAVTRTPAAERNRTASLVTYVNAEAPAIRDDRHRLPVGPPSSALTAGGSARYLFGWFWDGKSSGAITDREARHRFSLATCSGCHGAETATANQHIRPGPAGAPALLSGFLTGIDVADPADGAPTRRFDDLDRRATDLSAALTTPCFAFPVGTVLRASH